MGVIIAGLSLDPGNGVAPLAPSMTRQDVATILLVVHGFVLHLVCGFMYKYAPYFRPTTIVLLVVYGIRSTRSNESSMLLLVHL